MRAEPDKNEEGNNQKIRLRDKGSYQGFGRHIHIQLPADHTHTGQRSCCTSFATTAQPECSEK